MPTYRVDDVPALWRPFWLAYSWTLGIVFWIVLNVLHLTCRIRYEGAGPSAVRANYIYSLWHDSWFVYFVAFARSHHCHVWMQHPDAYMKPIHVILRLENIRILLGSEGEEGREAARELTTHLRGGCSSAISPDGPRGPLRVLKKGVLHLARDSGVPIMPLRLSASSGFRAGWDRKVIPLPWSTITVAFGSPIEVDEANFEAAGEFLSDQMSGSSGGIAESH